MESRWHGTRALTLKTQAKHNGVWSPHGWRSIMCQALSPPQDFSTVQILCTHYRSHSGKNYKPRSPACIHMQNDHTNTLNILLSLTVLGWLRKHQNNHQKLSVRIPEALKLDAIRKNRQIPSQHTSSALTSKYLCTVLSL